MRHGPAHHSKLQPRSSFSFSFPPAFQCFGRRRSRSPPRRSVPQAQPPPALACHPPARRVTSFNVWASGAPSLSLALFQTDVCGRLLGIVASAYDEGDNAVDDAYRKVRARRREERPARPPLPSLTAAATTSTAGQLRQARAGCDWRLRPGPAGTLRLCRGAL